MLTSLAQLAAFRLQCDRSFISLIDGEHQHIIAEATKSISLYKSHEHTPEDGLAFGAIKIDLMAGVCASTIKAFTSNDPRDHIDTPNVTANSSLYIIRDFLQEPYFKKRPYVAEWPHMRFYAEVPITSHAGYVLGSVCVVDNKVRNGLSTEDCRALAEIASTVQEYLYSLRDKKAYSRSVRLVKGLNAFLDPESYPLPFDTLSPSSVEGKPSSEQLGTGLETILNPDHVDFAQEHTDSTVSLSPKTSLSQCSRYNSQSPSAHRSHSSLTTLSNRVTDKEPMVSESPNWEPNTNLDTKDYPAAQVELGNSSRNTAVVKKTQIIFERACSHLRTAMDLEGMVFFSTRLSKRPHSLSNSDKVKPKNRSFEPQNGLDASELEMNTALHELPSYHPNTPEIQKIDSPFLSGQLGCSTGLRSASISSSEPTRNFCIPEDILQSMLERFPRGHIFKFDMEGLVSSPVGIKKEDDIREDYKYFSNHTDPSRTFNGENSQEYGPSYLSDSEIASFRNCFPDVRNLIFYPLRDERKERWIAAGIAWSTDPYKTFEYTDINYLTAFGNSIKIELSRHEVNALNETKSDFISSVSHEMRSPIHGILANVELLRSGDMEQKVDEDEYIEMINYCGRSLLDTVENLYVFLHFSKDFINLF